jgi:glutamate-1-semialdehyde 2,1-aminomutase
MSNRLLSQQAYEAACQVLPGGVNSPVRAFKGVGGHPIFMQRAEGTTLWDLDGNRYMDFIGSWGPAILGHASPLVTEAIQSVVSQGTSFGAPTALETEMAKQVIAMVPGIEKVRFVNSGTEAVMSGIRLARAYTGRTKLIKFEGCYHGHVDALLVKAGSGVATLSAPDSAGTIGTENTLLAQFNDLASVRRCLDAHPGEVAGILIEPVVGNMGCVIPAPGFLEGLRDLATAHDCLLLFDEVMTGFRLSPGGAQQCWGVRPDITMLGKIIGGGLPVGAYGASQAIMASVAPEGPMYQAGALSGNPLAMAAGLAVLKHLASNPEVYTRLNALTAQLAEGIRDRFPQWTVNQTGSMLTVFMTNQRVTDYASALKSDRAMYSRLFWHLIEAGIYFPPSQFESCFLSAAHTEPDIATVIQAFERFPATVTV